MSMSFLPKKFSAKKKEKISDNILEKPVRENGMKSSCMKIGGERRMSATTEKLTLHNQAISVF